MGGSKLFRSGAKKKIASIFIRRQRLAKISSAESGCRINFFVSPEFFLFIAPLDLFFLLVLRTSVSPLRERKEFECAKLWKGFGVVGKLADLTVGFPGASVRDAFLDAHPLREIWKRMENYERSKGFESEREPARHVSGTKIAYLCDTYRIPIYIITIAFLYTFIRTNI